MFRGSRRIRPIGKANPLESKSSQSPTVYVIAGPNGAGKTTFAAKFLPNFVRCYEFLNADLIAAGLSPFAPQLQNMRAGRLLLERIAELTERRADFAFETTLAGRTYVKLLSEMKANGYRIELFFLWLPSAEMAVARVANRVRQGGHDVPPEDIRRRYATGVNHLFRLYRPILDGCRLFDATRLPPEPIASEECFELTVYDPSLFSRIERQAEGIR